MKGGSDKEWSYEQFIPLWIELLMKFSLALFQMLLAYIWIIMNSKGKLNF